VFKHLFGITDNDKDLMKHYGEKCSWAWLCTPVISALEMLRQEDCEFEASQGQVSKILSYKKKERKKRKEKCTLQFFSYITGPKNSFWQ
jgi:hypothetical protein